MFCFSCGSLEKNNVYCYKCYGFFPLSPYTTYHISLSLPIPRFIPMAMAQVYIPNPHDSIPSLHLHTHTPPPPLPSPPLSVSSSLQDDDPVSFLPPAPPPSPEVQQRRFGTIFEIDPSRFEAPRKSELPPSPTNSFDFSAMFTPNKSPYESEPQSPTLPSPGNPLDSAYCSTHNSTSSQPPNPGSSSLGIPISPSLDANNCYSSLMSYSHSEGDTFRHGLRSQTALSQHPNSHDNCLSTTSPTLRPRSHTHPSHTVTPHTAQEQQQQLVRSFHPHLPHSFETTQLHSHGSSEGAAILDSGYHESVESPFKRKKLNLKRKSYELGYDPDPMDMLSYDSCSESACSSESDWQVIHPKGNKKACQEGENPVIRRQSASFSGVFTGVCLTPITDGLSNMSAPPTPNHSTTPFFQHDFVSLRHLSMSPPIFSLHHTPCPPTPTLSTDVPTSLQSMEVAEEGGVSLGDRLDSLDSMDTGALDHCVDMDSLSSTLRGSHLETSGHQNVTTSHLSPSHLPHSHLSPPHSHLSQNATVYSPSPQPSVPPCRSYSSGDGYSFSQEPQLAQGSNVYFSSYHEGGEGAFMNTGSAESKFVLSKSL